ncbi:Uncharacterized protein Rs2_16116 [Raphanus sativus]|nr:Uncharacterized protein Rs2_16116 [Raphanus sativus]
MAPKSKRGPLNGDELEIIQVLWGVPYAAIVELPHRDTPENVKPGDYRAFMAHFCDAHLSFPIPSFLLEILVELEMVFTQISPNFWRYVLTTFLRAREEGLEFGLAEMRQLYTIKQSSGFSGTILLAPREGRSVISGVPNKDVFWMDKFFVFKVKPATFGDFDFSWIPKKWNERVELFGCASMTPELRGLIAAFRPGECDWSSFTPERIRAAYALPPGLNRAAPILLAEPVRPRKDRKGKGVKRAEPLAEPSDALSDSEPLKRVRRKPHKRFQAPYEPGAGGETTSEAQRIRRRAIAEALSRELSISSSEPPYAKRDSGEGTSRFNLIKVPPDCQGGSSMAFSYDNDAPILENTEQLALIWRKIRTLKCELPPLEQMRGREAYVQMAVANAKLRRVK